MTRLSVIRTLALLLAACSDPRDLGGACTDCAPKIHGAGVLDPTSDDFHAAVLRRANWSFATCARCHGDNFDGGAAKVSCLTCHKDGPTACTTCHGSGPTSNAHGAHADASVTCSECHVVPAKWDDDGHILHDGVAITTPPKIVFGARANLASPTRQAPASFDGATCSQVYCHGDVLATAGGQSTKPRWTDAVTGACDRCHGAPPPSHARADCASCHPAAAPHADGTVDIGRTDGCNGCHGSATSIAPPTDLAGNTSTTSIGVGAHQAHLQARSRISAPIACATCHVVPATRDAAGHLDAAPADVVAGVGWDRTAQSCATTCHGAQSPAWTSSGQVFCGSCHGIPPSDGKHAANLPLTACAQCHSRTVDAFGNILVDGANTAHLNGVVDAE